MIDKELNDSLRKEFNPEGSDIRKLQMECLEILKELDRICDKHNIKYILSSGTLLGAVRHGGFIPWDDDLDIEMLKSEYKKLLKILPTELDPKFVVHSHKDDPYYVLYHIKIREREHEIIETFNISRKFNKKGFFVDIFSIEKNSIFTFMLGRYLWGALLFRPMDKLNMPKMYSIVVYFILFNILFPVINIFNFIFAKKYRHSMGGYFTKPRKKEYLLDVEKIEFEGFLFNAPKDRCGYLTDIYGDYMKIPDVKYIHAAEINLINK